MPIAITRPTGPELARCELTHLAREPIDPARAEEQHRAYVSALEELGARVVELPRLPEHPDAVFVEDAAIALDGVAVIARPGAESRRGETQCVAEALSEWRELVHLTAPSVLDGGDVVRLGETLLVGQSTRTNHAGLKQVAHALLPYGYRVKAVDVRGCLHLKSACCAIDGETVLCNPAWVDLPRMSGVRVIEVPGEEPGGANVLAVGGTVLVMAHAPRTAELLAASGYEVRTLDVSEFVKAEGALTCKSILFE